MKKFLFIPGDIINKDKQDVLFVLSYSKTENYQYYFVYNFLFSIVWDNTQSYIENFYEKL
jgi:hypothetical protein